jgi:hypothetical protein
VLIAEGGDKKPLALPVQAKVIDSPGYSVQRDRLHNGKQSGAIGSARSAGVAQKREGRRGEQYKRSPHGSSCEYRQHLPPNPPFA